MNAFLRMEVSNDVDNNRMSIFKVIHEIQKNLQKYIILQYKMHIIKWYYLKLKDEKHHINYFCIF